ncbi:MAG: quinone oxidoreductase [Rhizobiales bacterium]|nr:quinone oxidoreductase [Hyphomicrobiales bacterium]
MGHAIMVREVGGPEVMKYEPIATPKPGPGEVLIRQTAIGVNFLDTYFRSGLYPAPNGVPFIPGAEAVGVVEMIGAGVTTVDPGDRVAYVLPVGAYADERVVPVDRLVAIPDGIDDRTAAGMMLKGLTAQYLLRRTYNAKSGDTVLIHAAAGGVGLLMCQWARHLGITTIGTVGSEEKAALAKENGCTHTVLYRSENFVERVKAITDGKGVNVVYDSIGRDTYPDSLDCLKPMGTWVTFGQASGPIKDFDLGLLAKKGSLFATRPTLFSYIAQRSDLDQMSKELFEVVKSGAVKIPVNQQFSLRDASDAHRALEGRNTSGSTVLLPE